ncbi:hypothetical protein U9M48_030411 [Paspalum notatum var. saurae]|uniref:Uncharacterized protein n=1 Tax=Paspalum notatum var. saurae TaxID=547442 RepID=A0AAQ3U0Y7_PASNO
MPHRLANERCRWSGWTGSKCRLSTGLGASVAANIGAATADRLGRGRGNAASGTGACHQDAHFYSLADACFNMGQLWATLTTSETIFKAKEIVDAYWNYCYDGGFKLGLAYAEETLKPGLAETSLLGD